MDDAPYLRLQTNITARRERLSTSVVLQYRRRGASEGDNELSLPPLVCEARSPSPTWGIRSSVSLSPSRAGHSAGGLRGRRLVGRRPVAAISTANPHESERSPLVDFVPSAMCDSRSFELSLSGRLSTPVSLGSQRDRPRSGERTPSTTDEPYVASSFDGAQSSRRRRSILRSPVRRCWWNVEEATPSESATSSPVLSRGHSKNPA